MTFQLKVCVQNILTGQFKWFEFPESEQTIRHTLHIDDGDEYLIADWEGVNGINEYTPISSLNQLAEKMATIPSAYSSLINDWLGHYGSIETFIEEFDYNDWTVAEVSGDEDFGIYLVEELSAINIPEYLEPYFDYEAYGRDARLELSCIVSDSYYTWQ
ncbi:antirestriction protein ArdA [Streptococcus entericus]|uniref:antirestriction protein ArdA n=1 Tax=Streptococcus entericus TaxID=155680 RepID=UPI000368ED03|nr:antirestriction protein ArdA [Streptococcus entericus]